MNKKSYVHIIVDTFYKERDKLARASSLTETPNPKPSLPCLKRLLENGHELSLSDSLDVVTQLRDVIQPLRFVAKKKLMLLQECKEVQIGPLQGLARRLAPYSKPPPEYSDWSGVDSFCVPGYMFPCPDNSMIMRSLFYQGGAPEATLRCLPPLIEAELQSETTTLYKLRVTPTTPDSQCFVSIQFGPFNPFDAQKAPQLTAPGDFSIQAYSTAPHYLPSELTVKVLRLRPADSTTKTEITKGSSLYDALFWGQDSEEEDE